MQVNRNFPAYHGRMDVGPAIERLRTFDRPGAYLVRFKKEYLFSYISDTGEVKHETINNSRKTSLRQANPGLVTIQDTVEFLLNCDQNHKFVYMVSHLDFDEAAVFTNYQVDPNTCHACDRTFRDPKEVHNHAQIHKFAFCDICKTMVPQRSYTQHRSRCSDLKSKWFKCHLCNTFSTRYRAHLKKHIERKHGSQSAQCQYCDKDFGNAVLLENHVRKCHIGYDCSFCARHFRTKHGLNYHIKTNHLDSDHTSGSDSDNPPSPSPPSRSHDTTLNDDSCDHHHCDHHHCDQDHLLIPPRPPATCPAPVSPPAAASCTSPASCTAPASPSSPALCTAPASPCASSPAPPLSTHSPPSQNSGHPPGPNSGPCSPPSLGPTDMTSGFGPAQHSTPRRGRGFLRCPTPGCTYKAHSKILLRKHVKLVHRNKRSPPVFACKYCKDHEDPEQRFVTKYKKNLLYHQKHKCLGIARVPKVLNPTELWDIVSDVGISNRQAEKFLTGLCKKLGYRFVPKYLRKVLSQSLNSFRQCLTCEVLSFKDKSGEDASPTTLVYTQDLKSVIDKVIEARGIVKPFINIGIDGGKEKVDN